MSKNNLSSEQTKELLCILKTRFEKNMNRHKDITWDALQTRLLAQSDKLYTLSKMEQTGGEPDVVSYNMQTDVYTFCDCSPESPKGRRSICYDRKALEARKEHKPENTALDIAADMGVEILTEEQYRYLQTVGEFDLKTSSWVATPVDIRKLGGAIFCDRRYDTVFTYHNSADSYYGSRGFRGILKI